MAYVSLCKALYDYTATAEDELSFTEDALLYVLDAEDAEWWKAKLKVGTNETDEEDEGPVGLIPANYVEESEPIRVSKALYDYAKQNDDELNIEEDEMLSVYEIKGEWLLVKKQQDGFPSGQLGFVPANYVDEIAAVDGVTEPMEAAPLEEPEPEPYSAPAAAIPISNSTASIGAPRKVAKNDEIKMWAASELDAKKKKKKGTLGIGNSSLFFASESDKAPVQKINVLSIIGHSVEGKGKQLNLELDAQAAASANVDENNNLKFVMGSKGDVEEVWKKIEVSQEKAHAANAEPDEDQEEIAPAAANIPAPHPVTQSARTTPSAPIPPPAPPAPPATSILPPPSRATAVSKPPPAPSAPTPASNGAVAGEEDAIALYDFEAQGDDELTVAENEALILVEKETDDWWKVRNASGQEGVVPASYVEVVESGAEHGADQVAAGTAAMSVADEEDPVEARAAAEAAARAQEEEERQRMEEEEEAAERARLQEERRAKAEAQKRAREAEERRREALKSQPAPKPPRAPATTATTSASASRDVSIPSNRSAPARPKDAGKSKPSPARTRIWHDRTAQFKVEAEFLGFNQGKIRLHKLNGVVIEVAIEKMSHNDIQYLEEVTGRKLAPSRSSRSNGTRSGTNGASIGDGRSERDRDREKRREQEREQRRRQEAAKGPKRNIDWFEFFLASGVDIDDCTRYASAFERDKIDEAILPELDGSTLRSIGLREGDIIRVTKFISKRYNKGAATGSGSRSNDPSAQIRADEALARKLQEQEQAAKRNGTTPPPNLFSGPDGSLKNNTRRGRPNANPTRNTSGTVDAASLAAASESLARTSSPPSRSNNTSPEIVRSHPTASTTSGFDDDAWTPRPPSAKPATQIAATPTPPPQPPRPTSAAASTTAPAPAPAVSPAPAAPQAPVPATTPEVKADPNSALFDKLAAMKPASPATTPGGGRPGASPLGTGSMFNGPRGPFAPVASNQSMLAPLVPTQSTGQFMPTGLGHQPTGMGMQPQQTGWGGMQQMMPQQTGYMQPQQTGYGMAMSQPQSPFGMNAMVSQPTGFSQMMSPQMQQQQHGQQPLAPQHTQQQYSTQQQQQKQQEINNGPDRFSAANIFGQMKQGTMHQDANQAPQNSQKYDALRPQPTGFQPGGYINTQFTGYNGGSYGYQ